MMMSMLSYVKTPAPDPLSPIATVLVGAVFLFVIGYGIYCKILKQMDINAKNKRIIKNEVTQWTVSVRRLQLDERFEFL